MSDYKIPDHEMIVVAFDNENDADQVLDSLKGMESMDILDLKNAAVIVRDSSGEVKIKETSDFDTKQGAMGGGCGWRCAGLAGRRISQRRPPRRSWRRCRGKIYRPGSG